ncbi:DNA cytosine methyltransferase [Bradyrhizobium sp. NBAIM03]|uniref:DNA cytosine methyltransferase n=1 Tax=Bradyrhizobium sp. NBAIM03 TaxID=2793816 RepID=UPI001CD41873|nr:DNA cytosine methyltransferase [Bradyrhizobium sp. NBAIM03]MCA1533568.1 DNA cytosine methyltransferase [Bradyrhizobium sp. NBAIM03]
MTKAQQQRSSSKRKTNQLPKIVSLFSGAGGLDHGFKSAGFKLSAAFDISPAAIETHKRNFRGATATAGDLIALGPKGVASIVKNAVDVGSRIGIIGGPPCQGFSRANTTAKASDPRNQLPKGVQALFLVGLCKWLIGLSTSQNPPSILDVKNVLGYRVNAGAEVEDMVSIAIKFNPTHTLTKDPANLAAVPPVQFDECELATKALKRIGNLVDVDEYLTSQHEIRKEMIESMCQLLEPARYDCDEYRKLYSA